MNAGRINEIRARLTAAFKPTELEIIDESHLHAGHEGAKGGLGHFRVRIISRQFEGMSRIQSHRLVYDALGTLMQTDIHALSVNASAPAAD
ncbi:MAG: BolA family protein [Gammaproteobacteria bacterium]|jgi:BolA protein